MLWYLNYIFIPMNYLEFDNFIIICYDRLYLLNLVYVYLFMLKKNVLHDFSQTSSINTGPTSTTSISMLQQSTVFNSV